MAKAPQAAKPKPQRGVPVGALKSAVKSIAADKSQAAEFNGSAGKTQQQFMKEHGVNRDAFNLVMKLIKKESEQAQSTLRGIIELSHKMGLFDEIDAFDDIIMRMREIADEVEARRHNQTDRADPAVGKALAKDAEKAK